MIVWGSRLAHLVATGAILWLAYHVVRGEDVQGVWVVLVLALILVSVGAQMLVFRAERRSGQDLMDRTTRIR